MNPPNDASNQGATGEIFLQKESHWVTDPNQSANGTEVYAPIQRIALSDSIYPIYLHMYKSIIFKATLNAYI